ncbi:hypothetical protein [Aliiroseovarius subalbicans]|uniref:hypothetical protein n=1 Tax=Aliiroseovarius subalbicans TaxID=2925840 RepID=UPI001F5A355A|nr:hypothetical protein [Aliiroseovarius subalbicans]MCI2401121.1 hypothetical protein [Aliiroseovarius subalbicans]
MVNILPKQQFLALPTASIVATGGVGDISQRNGMFQPRDDPSIPLKACARIAQSGQIEEKMMIVGSPAPEKVHLLCGELLRDDGIEEPTRENIACLLG